MTGLYRLHGVRSKQVLLRIKQLGHQNSYKKRQYHPRFSLKNNMEFLNSLNDLSIEDFGIDNKNRSDRGDPRGGQSGSILEKLAGEKRFSMITEMIEKSGGSLRDSLDGPKQRVTFFAPTNEALTKFHDMVKDGKGQGEGLLEGGGSS
jgi:hypothetical protein